MLMVEGCCSLFFECKCVIHYNNCLLWTVGLRNPYMFLHKKGIINHCWQKTFGVHTPPGTNSVYLVFWCGWDVSGIGNMREYLLWHLCRHYIYPEWFTTWQWYKQVFQQETRCCCGDGMHVWFGYKITNPIYKQILITSKWFLPRRPPFWLPGAQSFRCYPSYEGLDQLIAG